MGNIRVIGPRGSGKTTYLAALAYQPLRAMQNYKGLQIQPVNDDTRKLVDWAENIICEGASLEPTSSYVTDVYDLPMYAFAIELQQWLRNSEKINLVVRDYPGEIFEELAHGAGEGLYAEFVDECLTPDINGCLILLSDWQRNSTDKLYSRMIQKFIGFMDSHERTKDLRLAVAMSKCERGELWPTRLDPETDLFSVHLPKTRKILRDAMPQQNLGFYAISTFGVLGKKDPRPNRVDEWNGDGRVAVLRDANRWQPYNLVAPLYWLSTGRSLGNDA